LGCGIGWLKPKAITRGSLVKSKLVLSGAYDVIDECLFEVLDMLEGWLKPKAFAWISCEL
jgi:hypothetical protein